MKRSYLGLGVALIISTVSATAAETSEPPAKRVGVYDSRAVAVAAVGSEYYAHHIKPLEDAFSKAKVEGDEELIKELEPRVWERRKQTHRQGFGTAPVDEILEYLKDALTNIVEEADVDILLSKWDEEGLSKYPSAERVDVTMPLVEAFKPNPRSLGHAKAIQEVDPIPDKELDEHLAREGH